MATQAPPQPRADHLRSTCWSTANLQPKYPPLNADVEADVVIVGAGVAGLATAMRLLKPPTTSAAAAPAAAAAPPSVVVLEARVRSGGMTGRSTAHVMQWVDDYVYKVEGTHGSDGAQKVARAQEFAVEEVGRLAALAAAGGGNGGSPATTNPNPCGFKPGVGYLIPAEPPTSSSSSSIVHGAAAGTAAAAAAAVAGAGATAATPPPTTLFSSTGDSATQRALLERELAACQRAGVSGVELVDLGGGPQVGRARLALKFPLSAEVDPVALCEGLAEAVVAAGGRIFEGTRALSGGVVTGGIGSAQGEVRTTGGFVARAKRAVVTATCSPCDRNVLVHARQHPCRTFAVALEIDEGAFCDGDGGSSCQFWSTAEPYHYVRLAPSPLLTATTGEAATTPTATEKVALLVGGCDHAVGALGSARAAAADAANKGPYQELEAWARRRWPACGRVLHRWTGIVIEPSDFLGLYGEAPSVPFVGGTGDASGDGGTTTPNPKHYIITGDSGQGITGAAIASDLVARQVLGLPLPEWADLYSPSRGLKPLLHAPSGAVSEAMATTSGLARALPAVGFSRGGSFGGAAGPLAGLRRVVADAATALWPGALERAEARLAPGEGVVLQMPLWRSLAAAGGGGRGGGGGHGGVGGPVKRALLAGKVASWRDPETGAVVRRSALCTHMGCALSWNALDGTFDCGCHGSVFDGKGRVCSGPAVVDLEELPGGGGR